MSESNPPEAAAAMPLFFNSVVAISAEAHGALRLDRGAGFGFAAGAQAIPIGLGEFDVASQHYPIVFTTGPQPTPVVLLGLGAGVNAFVTPEGAWRADCYIPAYVRAYPFIFVEDRVRGTTVVGMEPTAACLHTTGGAALFEDGKPSPALNEAINFCAAFRDSVNLGTAFGTGLEAAGLLVEEEATVNFTAGGTAKIRGFKVLKPERLETVDDATYLDWRRRGWIAAIYAHLHSAARWSRLVEVAAAAAVPTAQG